MTNSKKALMIGGGISNCSLARMLLDDGWYVEIREKRDRLGGMLADEYDEESGCYVPWYGPHIIHFDEKNSEALGFLKSHVKIVPVSHQILCIGNGNFTYWPINPVYKELFEFLNPRKSMKEEFIDSYSRKIWGHEFNDIIKNINERVRIKEARDKDAFSGEEQFQPENGYTNMLNDLTRGCKVIFNREENLDSVLREYFQWDLVIVSSNIDQFFGFRFGKLDFKGLDFIFKKIKNNGTDILPTPVVNLNTHSKVVRVGEINQLQANKNTSSTRILCFDMPGEQNRFYPVNNESNLSLLKKYTDLTRDYEKIKFHGRTANYKYLDIDECIQNSIRLFREVKSIRSY